MTLSPFKSLVSRRPGKPIGRRRVPRVVEELENRLVPTSATWTGATGALWSNSSSWAGAPSVVPGTGDTATFSGAGTITADLTGGVTINTILFDTSSAGAYSIGTGQTQTLTLNAGGGITMNSTVANNESIKAKVVLGTAGGTYTLTSHNATKLLFFSAAGNVAFTGAPSGSLTTTLDVVADQLISGGPTVSIVGGIQDGTGNSVRLVKDGAGSLQISSSSGGNTYTGGTYLNSGALLVVGNSGSLQSNSSLFIANGTYLSSVNQGSGNYTGIAQQWNGDWTFNDSTKGNSSIQQMTFNSGSVDLGATGTDAVRTVTALASTLTVNSVISNGSNGITTGLTTVGGGSVTLGGSNAYTGPTTVFGPGGTLTLSGTNQSGGTLNVSNGSVLNLSGSGTISNPTAINLNNGGNLTFTNTNTAQGALTRVNASAALAVSGNSTITYANNSGANLTYAQTLGAITLTNGQLNAVLSTNMAGSSNTQTLTLTSLTRGATDAVTFSALTTTPNATTNVIHNNGATASTILGPWATVGTTAALQTDYAAYDASKNVTAANVGASADTTWTDSTQLYTNSTTPLTLATGFTHGLLGLRNTAATATLTVPSGGNLNTYGLLNGAATTWTIASSGGVVTTPSGGGKLFVTTGSGAVTISAPIQDNGNAVTLVASGANTLTLSGANNSFSGGVVLNGGTLLLTDAASSAALGTGTFTINGGNIGTSIASWVNANNNPMVWNGSFTLTTANTLGMNLGNGAITLNNVVKIGNTSGKTNFLMSGPLSGSGGLIIGGVCQITGTGTFTGNTQVVGSGTTFTVGNLTLQNSAFDTTGAGFPTFNSTTPQLGGILGPNNWALSNTLTSLQLNLGAGVTQTYTGNLSGGASTMTFTKAGSGTQIFTGTNSLTGPTNIVAGALALTGSGAINASSGITINGSGARFITNSSVPVTAPITLTQGTIGGTGTIGAAVSVGSNGVLSPGNSPGTQTYSNGLTWAGGGTYLWEVDTVTTASASQASFKGVDPGFDWINVTGTLNITANISSKFTIDINGLLHSTHALGAVANWDNTKSYDWIIASATTITGFNPAAFNLTTTHFAGNNPLGSGTFSITQINNTIVLHFVGAAPNDSVLTASPTSISFGRVMSGSSGTQALTISLTPGGTSVTGATVSGTTGVTLDSTASGAGAITSTANYVVNVGLTNALGSHVDAVTVTNTGDDGSGGGGSSAATGQGNAQTPISVGVTGTVLQNRVITADTVDFGLVHVGASVSGGTTLRTTGDSDHNTSVSVPNSTGGGFSISGGNTDLTFDSASVTDSRTLTGMLTTPGAFTNQTALALTPGTEAGVAGTQLAVATLVPFSANVYSGSSRWTADTAGSWAGNVWSDTTTPSIQAAPGTFAGFANTDVAIFDGASNGRIVNLDNASPSLSSLVLADNAGGAGYQINPGSGNGAITLHGSSAAANLTIGAGNHAINVPVVLASDLSVGVTDAAGSVAFGGGISGTGGLVKTGSGTLSLSGDNSFSGNVTIAGGRLLVNNPFTKIVNADWTVNSTTFTTATPHGLTAGKSVVISGVIPSGYNGTYTVVSATPTSFTVAISNDPGHYVSGGAIGSGFGSGNVFVQEGASIGGSGRFSGRLTIDDGGNFSPGNSPGTIGTGDLELKSGSIMNEEIASDSSYDIVNVTGTINLNVNAIPNGGAKLRIILTYVPVNGTTYTIITNDDVDPITNRFRDYATSAVLNEGDAFAAGGNRFTISYAGGPDNNDVVLTVANPEITSLTPFVGPTAGGSTIVIAGLNFSGASSLTFGGTPATSFTVNSPSQITAVAPAGVASTVDVVVTNTTIASATAGTGNDYTFVAPSISSVVVNGGNIVARDRYNQTPALTPSLVGGQSVVEQLLVTFNQRVKLDPGAFSISSLSGSVTALGATPSASAATVTATGVSGTGNMATGYTQYVLTFDAGAAVNSHDSGSPYLGNAYTTLKDGLYQLDSAGALMHAGLATLANRSDPFWALFGANSANDVKITGAVGGGDDTLLVDGLALNDVYSTFGSNSNSAGPPTYNVNYDWNLDGNVDGIDLTHLYGNFGTIWKF